MNRRLMVAVAALVLGAAACEKPRNNSSWSTESPESAASFELVPGATPSRGVGPVSHIDVASLDISRASEGQELFKTRCSACHRIEERYIGPALLGVTKRRQPEWILNMILRPELMLKEDPVAQGLLATHLVPMANQNLTQHEAESILVFFRQNDKDLPDQASAEPVAEVPAGETHKGPPGTN